MLPYVVCTGKAQRCSLEEQNHHCKGACNTHNFTVMHISSPKFNPFHTTNIQAETMYKVIAPSIKTSILNIAACMFPWLVLSVKIQKIVA